MRALAVCLMAVPVGFGALRALTTGTDFRYLVTAVAALVVSGVTIRVGAPRVRSRGLLSLLALGLSTLAGGIAAFGQGATSVAAVVVVATLFALCVTTGGMLLLRARAAAG